MRSALPTVIVLLAAATLLWNVLAALFITRQRGLPGIPHTLTALAGLLIVPAVIVAVSSGSIVTGRTTSAIGWLWPLALALFAAQSVAAVSTGLVSRWAGIPLALFNSFLAISAIAIFAGRNGDMLPDWLLAFEAARSGSVALAAGGGAMFTTLILHVPVLAPAYRSNWRSGATLRGVLVLSSVCWLALFASQIPPSTSAIQSYRRLPADLVFPPLDKDFSIGIVAFPVLRGTPTPIARRDDIALVMESGVKAVAIQLDYAYATPLVIDSIARILEPLRRDSVVAIVRMGTLPPFTRMGAVPELTAAERLDRIAAVAARVRPGYILHDPPRDADGTIVATTEDENLFLAAASERVTRASANTRLALSLWPTSSRDSVLYQWASTSGSPVHTVGFDLWPGVGGGATLEARLIRAERWIQLSRSTKDHWVFSTGGFPSSHGADSQVRAIRGVVLWAMARPRFQGVVVGRAGEYGTGTGLRNTSGRLREAAEIVKLAAYAARTARVD